MDKKLVESYLDNIAELVIDEDKIVTYKSLSKSLGIHVNTAKQLLYTFLTKEKSKNSFPISATYLLAGKLADGSFNISIVNEVDLKSTHLKFVEITSEHVYSIQKGKELRELKVLHGIDKDSSNAESPLVVKCSKCVLKTRGEGKEKQEYCQDNSKKIIENALAPQKEKARLVEPDKKAEGFVKNETLTKSPTKKSPKGNSTKAQADARKAAGTIANLFAKANQRNAEKSARDKNAIKNQHKNDEPVSVSNDETVEAKEADLKTEKKSSGRDSSRSKKSGNKRKRIQMISDSEDSDSCKEEPSPVEDVSVIFPSDTEDKKEVKESAPQNKRKKRKVIDKTVLSEDGYLETRKEIVFETDSEDEVEEVKADVQQKKTKTVPVNDKGKGIQTANTAKKQSSLLTFFKKS